MSASKTILVVDDEVPIRRAIELKFQAAGYAVLTASDGREGLTCIHQYLPDAVITDLTMPNLDGRQLCELTNDLKQSRPFLTVVITARIAPDEQQWMAGMDDVVFMEKPFSPIQLLQTVDNYFGGRS